MPAKSKDSMANTFITATVLCLVCSFLVSAAAVGLKSLQDRNVEVDRKKNILQVTGFEGDALASADSIEKTFSERFETLVIDLDTGAESPDKLKEALDAAKKDLGDDYVNKYDQIWASKKKLDGNLLGQKLTNAEDVAGIKYREKYSHVFILKDENGVVEKYVFPVRGYGLWSMLKGYLAVESDFQTVAGLTFYEQKETPGLGGEVQNPQWKAYWQGKKVYDPETGGVELGVVKGAGKNEYEVDGLSGATITGKGVSNMIEYWMGPEGFGPFIEKRKSNSPKSSASINSAEEHNG